MIDSLAIRIDGGLLSIVVVLIGLEALWFVWRWRRQRSGLPPGKILWNLLSGAALMMAVAAALENLPRSVVAICLSVSLVAHLLDLRARLKAA